MTRPFTGQLVFERAQSGTARCTARQQSHLSASCSSDRSQLVDHGLGGELHRVSLSDMGRAVPSSAGRTLFPSMQPCTTSFKSQCWCTGRSWQQPRRRRGRRRQPQRPSCVRDDQQDDQVCNELLLQACMQHCCTASYSWPKRCCLSLFPALPFSTVLQPGSSSYSDNTPLVPVECGTSRVAEGLG